MYVFPGPHISNVDIGAFHGMRSPGTGVAVHVCDNASKCFAQLRHEKIPSQRLIRFDSRDFGWSDSQSSEWHIDW